MRDNPEELVIGCCLLNEDSVPFAANVLEPDDFASANLAEVFRAIVFLKKTGKPVEPYSVWVQAQENGLRGLEVTKLHEWAGAPRSAGSVAFYADQVKENSTRRKLSIAGMKYQQDAANMEIPAAQTVSDMLNTLKGIRDGSTNTNLEALTLREILDIPETPADWIIPDLLQKRERMIITGWEGLGKTTWIRQMSICMAAGLNPITLDHINPVRVLVVDVENTNTQWRNETRGIVQKVQRIGQVDPTTSMRVHCGNRMDVRRDKDLGLIHRLVDEHDPEVLFIGPIYKLLPNAIQTDDDAAPLITALDSLRDRGLGLIMEAHATKASREGGSLAPRGSNALTGWPEFGFGLAPTDDGAEIQRWRGDRSRDRQWPKKLFRGTSGLPWVADNIHPETRHAKVYEWDKRESA